MFQDNMGALYSLLMANFSSVLRSKIKSHRNYDSAAGSLDPIWLMETLENVMTNFDEIQNTLTSIHYQMKRIMTLYQKKDESNEDFIKSVLKEIKVYERHGGNFYGGLINTLSLTRSLSKRKPYTKKTIQKLSCPTAKSKPSRNRKPKSSKKRLQRCPSCSTPTRNGTPNCKPI